MICPRCGRAAISSDKRGLLQPSFCDLKPAMPNWSCLRRSWARLYACGRLFSGRLQGIGFATVHVVPRYLFSGDRWKNVPVDQLVGRSCAQVRSPHAINSLISPWANLGAWTQPIRPGAELPRPNESFRDSSAFRVRAHRHDGTDSGILLASGGRRSAGFSTPPCVSVSRR